MRLAGVVKTHCLQKLCIISLKLFCAYNADKCFLGVTVILEMAEKVLIMPMLCGLLLKEAQLGFVVMDTFSSKLLNTAVF